MRATDAQAERYLSGLTAPPVTSADVVDNREQVQDTQNFPWAGIGQVLATFPNGTMMVSSGALAGSQYIMTAGHALYNPALGGLATSVVFTPGRSDDYQPYGVFNVGQANMYVAPNFVSGTETDYGMLDLGVNLAMLIGGEYSLMNLSDQALSELGEFLITGYPIDKGGDEMWTAEGVLAAYSDDYLFTETAFASAGESGGPASAFFPESNEFGIVGIYMGSNPAGMTCIRINDAVIAQYQAWMP